MFVKRLPMSLSLWHNRSKLNNDGGYTTMGGAIGGIISSVAGGGKGGGGGGGGGIMEMVSKIIEAVSGAGK